MEPRLTAGTALRTPPFALADVTNEPLFSGGKLCELTFSDVRAEIAERGLIK